VSRTRICPSLAAHAVDYRSSIRFEEAELPHVSFCAAACSLPPPSQGRAGSLLVFTLEAFSACPSYPVVLPLPFFLAFFCPCWSRHTRSFEDSCCVHKARFHSSSFGCHLAKYHLSAVLSLVVCFLKYLLPLRYPPPADVPTVPRLL